jgi:hypothetical protein
MLRSNSGYFKTIAFLYSCIEKLILKIRKNDYSSLGMSDNLSSLHEIIPIRRKIKLRNYAFFCKFAAQIQLIKDL